MSLSFADFEALCRVCAEELRLRTSQRRYHDYEYEYIRNLFIWALDNTSDPERAYAEYTTGIAMSKHIRYAF